MGGREKESPANRVLDGAGSCVRVVTGRNGPRTLAESTGGDAVAFAQAVVPIGDRVATADDLEVIVVAARGSWQALALRAAAKRLVAILVRRAVAGDCARKRRWVLSRDNHILDGTSRDRPREQRRPPTRPEVRLDLHRALRSRRVQALVPDRGMQNPAMTAGRSAQGSMTVVDWLNRSMIV